MLDIEFGEKQEEQKIVIESYKRWTVDGKWELTVKAEAGKSSFMLYYFPMAMLGRGETYEEAYENFLKNLEDHIKNCDDLRRSMI